MLTCPKCGSSEWRQTFRCTQDPANDAFQCEGCGAKFKRYDKPPPRLYARFGDSGEYEQLPGTVELAQRLKALDIPHVERANEYGIKADGWSGWNYISVYYGTDKETPVRGLTDDELTSVNAML